MNGVGAWQHCERWMPPAQCRVTWFLKSSREAQVVPLRLVNSKIPCPSGGPHRTPQECLWGFSGALGRVGSREGFSFGGK